MSDTFAPRHGSLAVFHFIQANVADAQTNVDLALADVGTNTLVPMPAAGFVAAVACKLNAAVTAGTLTIQAHASSTEYGQAEAPAAVLSTSNTTFNYDTARPRAVNFAAGDQLGLSITTASLLPDGTADLDAWLYVMLQGDPAS